MARHASELPNVEEFHSNEWFVRFVYRNDAISAYTDDSLNNVSFLDL